MIKGKEIVHGICYLTENAKVAKQLNAAAAERHEKSFWSNANENKYSLPKLMDDSTIFKSTLYEQLRELDKSSS